MWNDKLDEPQAGIKISRRNINNLRYADETTLVAEGEKELKSLLMKVKEESEQAGLKLNIQKIEIMASSPITSRQIDGEKVETTTSSKLGKEHIKAVYCHAAYLIYMQRTSCEMLGWMKHKLESGLPEEISITSDMQMTPPLWQKAKN